MAADSTGPLFEFFCGAGMARLALQDRFRCVFANDMDRDKAAAYAAAHGDAHLRIGDVWDLSAEDLPGRAALAWASSPCQDLSMAGRRLGLAAPRSGAFFGFWRLMQALAAEGRAPQTIVLENVTGLFTARAGADFVAVVEAMAGLGYQVGALEMDAALFTPQSRPRAFIIAARDAPGALTLAGPAAPFHTPAVIAAHKRLPNAAAQAWRWWRLPAPALRNATLSSCLEPADATAWRRPEDTAALLALMAPTQRQRLEALRNKGAPAIGAAFRRVRIEDGARRQRLEARFDGLAGCVRTPGGGSSRQFLLAVEENGVVRSRLLTARECARLMGLPDDFPLPASETKALRVIGDGVCVPTVRWLGEQLLAPLCGLSAPNRKAA